MADTIIAIFGVFCLAFLIEVLFHDADLFPWEKQDEPSATPKEPTDGNP